MQNKEKNGRFVDGVDSGHVFFTDVQFHPILQFLDGEMK